MQLMIMLLLLYNCMFVSMYLDDILIYNERKYEPLEHTTLMFETLVKEELWISLKKCELFLKKNWCTLGLLYTMRICVA
jgi:hypothetical protein